MPSDGIHDDLMDIKRQHDEDALLTDAQWSEVVELIASGDYTFHELAQKYGLTDEQFVSEYQSRSAAAIKTMFDEVFEEVDETWQTKK